MKLNWRMFLSRREELLSSEFSQSKILKVEKEGVVAKAEEFGDGDLKITLEGGESLKFLNKDTWARLGGGNRIILHCSSTSPSTVNTFKLAAPFVMPESTAEEKATCYASVIGYFSPGGGQPPPGRWQ